MNFEVLMTRYSDDPRILKITDEIVLPDPQKIHLTGLNGSASQFIISTVFNNKSASGPTTHVAPGTKMYIAPPSSESPTIKALEDIKNKIQMLPQF